MKRAAAGAGRSCGRRGGPRRPGRRAGPADTAGTGGNGRRGRPGGHGGNGRSAGQDRAQGRGEGVRPGVPYERQRRLGAEIAGPNVVADHGVELIDRRRAPESGRTAAGHAAVQKDTNLTPLFISEPGRGPEINNRENILLEPQNRRSQQLNGQPVITA